MAEIEGIAELQKKLAKLGEAAGGKALRNATKQAMLPVLQAARSSAPVGKFPHKSYKGRVLFPGYLSRSVDRNSALSRDKQTAWGRVGVKPEAFYGVQFIERGWTTRGGKTKVPAQPWLEPAFNRSQEQVLGRLKNRLARQIDKARK